MRACLRRPLSSPLVAWSVLLMVVGLLVVLIATAYWQAAATGPQVQVPMFYDAHYLFPRPWTQEQEAPGVPPPAPVAAVYGDNRVSQAFVAGADHLALITLWLAGKQGERVTVSLQGPSQEAYDATFTIDTEEGRFYRFGMEALPHTSGKSYRLTVQAPSATVEHPVTVRSVGGDRLGASIELNEYSLPGNLEMYTYSRAWPGRWWFAAIGEQVLPDIFRVRLRQYKPDFFKGRSFEALTLLTLLLGCAFLILARGWQTPLRLALPWSLTLLLIGFLSWQAASARMTFAAGRTDLRPSGVVAPAVTSPPGATRLVDDFVLSLWTAVREPEARFIAAAWQDNEARISVPIPSRITYPLTVPPGARLRTGISKTGVAPARFSIWVGGALAQEVEIGIAGEDVTWIDVDLSPWVGQATTFSLVVEGEGQGAQGAWLRPQLTADGSWLLTSIPRDDPAFVPTFYEFGDSVRLLGYAPVRDGDGLNVRLFWQATHTTQDSAKVFVHLLDTAGVIISQSDGVPVAGTYPLPLWSPGLIIVDEHRLLLPDGLRAGSSLAIGLYDPGSGLRWPAVDGEGERLADDRVLLPLEIERSGRVPMQLVARGGTP